MKYQRIQEREIEAEQFNGSYGSAKRVVDLIYKGRVVMGFTFCGSSLDVEYGGISTHVTLAKSDYVVITEIGEIKVFSTRDFSKTFCFSENKNQEEEI